MFCTQDYLLRQRLLHARGTAPVSQREPHHFCFTERDLTSRQRVRQGTCIYGTENPGSGGRGFRPNKERFTLILNSGALDYLLEDELIQSLLYSTRVCNKLEKPKTIIIAVNENVFAAATGTVWRYIIDQAGQRVSV